MNVETAYVAGAAPGGADTNVPLMWRTHDGGKTWTKIVNGLPSDQRTGSWVNVIREDPKQKGLLFCGTETTVYVSFDDGDHWQSLRQNLPSTSIRDLVFHSDDHMNDLVIGTYGRGFWVLDDMSPLRELAARAQTIAAAPAYLFKPGDAIRARINANWDQPMSVELPADVAAEAKALDTKLATFGGAVTGRGGRGGGPPAPGAVTSFIALNGSFNTMVSMMQVGLDMAPTKAQIDTWESNCKNYNTTVTAWKTMQSQDLAAFNALLSKNQLQPLVVTPTKLSAPSCTFTPPVAR